MSKRIAFSNFNEDQTSYIRNDATASRIWQIPDRSMTFAGTDEVLLKGTSAGLYAGEQLHRIPGLLNQDSTAVEFLNLGSVGTHVGDNVGRVLLPKGFVTLNWSQNFVLNWKWNNTLSRAEPFDVAYPMIGTEFGGEGFLVHYTAPGGIPATSFHEIIRFGGGVEGLSGVNSLTTYIPFNQFKATIYAAWSSTTTPPAATTESWWGGTGNTLGGVINPLLWLNTEETKGSGYNLNELARFSSYGTATYPGWSFEHSGGTFQTKTIATTNATVGMIRSNIYDGSAFQNTASIDFLTRGTMSAGNVGQSIRFSTSATNTAGLSQRLEITNDGTIRFSTPFQGEGTSISIPSYSAAGYTPALTTTTGYRQQVLSTAGGGYLLQAFTSVTNTAIPVFIRGVHGHTSPTVPTIIFSATKHNGTTNFTDIAAAEVGYHFRNNTTTLIEILGNGNAGFLQTTPTAVVDLGAVTTSRASLRVRAGSTTVAPSSPNAGDIWHQGTNNRLMFRKGASSQEIMSAVQVNSVTPTSPNRTIELTIDGITYYIHSKTTND